MSTLRLSVTELDAHRHWLNDEPWMTTEKLIDQLRGKDEPNDKMLAGSAFHEQLESLQDGEELDDFERNGLRFEVNLDGEFFLPKVVEVKTEKVYLVDGVEVRLVGKADAVHGRQVFDHKLSGDFDAEKYLDSLQWRAYLVMFDAKRFTYNVFTGNEKKGVWVVSELNQFSVTTYPNVARDVEEAVRELTRFIVQYVPERIGDAVAEAKALEF